MEVEFHDIMHVFQKHFSDLECSSDEIKKVDGSNSYHRLTNIIGLVLKKKLINVLVPIGKILFSI